MAGNPSGNVHPGDLTHYRGFDIVVDVAEDMVGVFRPSYRLRLEDGSHLPVKDEQSTAPFDTVDDARTAALIDARANIDAMLSGGV